jgi:hypothetical protein
MYLRRSVPFVLAATIALSVPACGWGDEADGGGANRATGARSVTTLLDPLTDRQVVGDLFEVEADRPEYWRMFTLDRYDGASWTSSKPDGSEGAVSLSVPASLRASDDGRPPGAETLNQTIHILSDMGDMHALPLAQTPERISGAIGQIKWDPMRSQAFIDGDLQTGMTYLVRSMIVVPTPAELDRVVHLAPAAYGHWTALPENLDPRIERIAERWTADATSDYRRVLAIQQRFQQGDFVYSTDVDTADDDESMVEFLTQTRTGFCLHYSSAMAIMVRALGLPARIGVGYRAGTRQADGGYLVRSDDAHVWVEVLFPGYGWLEFEPEAGTVHPNARAGTYLNPVPATDAP